MYLNNKELKALGHALGNVLCQQNHPDHAVLTQVREKVRVELGHQSRGINHLFLKSLLATAGIFFLITVFSSDMNPAPKHLSQFYKVTAAGIVK